jgi:hypothetical protein
MKVQATVPEKKNEKGEVVQKAIGPFTIEVTTGSTGAECIALFGDEAVKTNAESNWTVTIQTNMRSAMKRGETQEQIQTRLATAKMGVAQKGAIVDPVQAYLAKFQSATPAEQQKMLAELKSRAATTK